MRSWRGNARRDLAREPRTRQQDQEITSVRRRVPARDARPPAYSDCCADDDQESGGAVARGGDARRSEGMDTPGSIAGGGKSAACEEVGCGVGEDVDQHAEYTARSLCRVTTEDATNGRAAPNPGELWQAETSRKYSVSTILTR